MKIEHSIVIRFQTELCKWGDKNIKSYPWRFVDDPYLILVSEFMLHRTQAVQVQPIYNDFIKLSPNLSTFIKVDIAKVQNILYPLGLNWRINALIQALKRLSEVYENVPPDFDKLISIPGVGPYIAGATVCFSKNYALPLIDTNTVRVVGRVFDLDIRGEARRKKEVIDTITKVVDQKNPRHFYYAMIDLAHAICVPKNPLCLECPLNKVPCGFVKG